MTPQPAIAHYRLISKLGEGGMGAVYRATDTKLNRDVAIKILPDAFASDADRLARFTREAQVLAQLNHPNIAAVYGVEDRAIVMELVEGADLRGPLTPGDALPIIDQLIDALEYAHDKGIIHRDLKPANLRLTPDGRLKVLDFGLAKALSSDPTQQSTDNTGSPTLTMRATMAGVIMGTASYMSPEQARGQAVDKRADIWSFGVLLYELLTGKQLFDGGTVSDTLAAVLRQDLDLAAVPARFRKLLAKCLTRDPRQRLRDISGARLLLEDQTPQAHPAQIHTARWPLIVAAAALLSLAVLLWHPWPAGDADSNRPLLQLDTDVGAEFRDPTISPDGSKLAFILGNKVAFRKLSDRKVNVLDGTDDARYPFFSPDGKWIAFTGRSKLQKIAVDGGAPIAIADAESNQGGAGWWGDGNRIVAVLDYRTGLYEVSAMGGSRRKISDVNNQGATFNAQRQHVSPQILPGGDVLFTSRLGNGQTDSSIEVYQGRTGKTRVLMRGAAMARYLRSGHLLYQQNSAIFAAPMDLGKMELTGPGTPLIDDVRGFEIASNGTLVYRSADSTARFTIGWLDQAGGVEPVLSEPAEYRSPMLSPDGTKLAFSAGPAKQHNIWVYDFARRIPTRLTFDPDSQEQPVWTPDGAFLLFRSGNTGVLNWVRSIGGKVERLPSDPRNNAFPYSFSPDGKTLAFSEFEDSWIVSIRQSAQELSFGKPQLLVGGPGLQMAPKFSPDGRWVVYESSEYGRRDIYVIRFPGPGEKPSGKWQVSDSGGEYPVFSPDGSQIFYRGLDSRIRAVRYTARGDSFQAEKPRVWSSTPISSSNAPFDVSRDGKRIIAALPVTEGRPDTHIRVVLNVAEELRRRSAK